MKSRLYCGISEYRPSVGLDVSIINHNQPNRQHKKDNKSQPLNGCQIQIHPYTSYTRLRYNFRIVRDTSLTTTKTKNAGEM